MLKCLCDNQFVGAGIPLMRRISSPRSYVPCGLLKNVAGDNFSSQLEFSRCLKLVSSKMVLRNAVEADGTGMADVNTKIIPNMQQFLTSNKICGREKTISQLTDMNNLKNQFIIVTGSYSVGKTKILKHIVEDQDNCVVEKPSFSLMINGRTAGKKSMELAFLEELHNYPKVSVVEPIMKHLQRLAANLKYTAGTTFDASGAPFLTASVEAVSTARTVDHTTALDLLLTAATASETSPLKLIIFDEANHFFTPPAAKLFLKTGQSSPEWEVQRQQIMETLQLLVSFTKEKGAMNVILSTSDNSFPSALKALGFDFKFFSSQIVIGEPSPMEALAVVKEWGVGDNLASALVDVYGGHLAMISNELVKMGQTMYWEGEDKVLFGLEDNAKLVDCLAEAHARSPKLKALVLQSLRLLAQNGFVPTKTHSYTVPTVIRSMSDGMRW